MELRIFCQKGDCNNMLSLDIKLGYSEKDILYKHGWIKKDGLIMCPECQWWEREKADIRKKKSA